MPESFVLPVGTAIPGAVAAVMNVAQTNLPANATVYFGSELPSYSNPWTFQITEVSGDQAYDSIGPRYRREETFNLICLLTYYDGSNNFPGLLATVMQQFTIIATAIGANPSLTDYTVPGVTQVVRVAEVGNFIVTPATDANGRCACTLSFNVRCAQRVESISGD